MDVGARVRTAGEHNAGEGDVRRPASANLACRHGHAVLGHLPQDEPRVRKRRGLQRTRPTRRQTVQLTTTAACALLATVVPIAMAQESCISLAESTACPAFNASSISTNSDLTGLFPFLSDVTDVQSFDSEIQNYVSGDFARTK